MFFPGFQKPSSWLKYFLYNIDFHAVPICIYIYTYIYYVSICMYMSVYVRIHNRQSIMSSSKLTKPWPDRGLEDSFPLKNGDKKGQPVNLPEGNHFLRGLLESLSSQAFGGFLKPGSPQLSSIFVWDCPLKTTKKIQLWGYLHDYGKP